MHKKENKVTRLVLLDGIESKAINKDFESSNIRRSLSVSSLVNVDLFDVHNKYCSLIFVPIGNTVFYRIPFLYNTVFGHHLRHGLIGNKRESIG